MYDQFPVRFFKEIQCALQRRKLKYWYYTFCYHYKDVLRYEKLSKKQSITAHKIRYMDLTNTFFIKVCNAKVKTRDSLKQHRKKVHRLVTPIPESCVLKPDDPELLRPILSVQVSFLLQLLYKIPSLLFFFIILFNQWPNQDLWYLINYIKPSGFYYIIHKRKPTQKKTKKSGLKPLIPGF